MLMSDDRVSQIISGVSEKARLCEAVKMDKADMATSALALTSVFLERVML